MRYFISTPELRKRSSDRKIRKITGSGLRMVTRWEEKKPQFHKHDREQCYLKFHPELMCKVRA